MRELKQDKSAERALLVGMRLKDQRLEDVEESMAELGKLAETAQADVVTSIIQRSSNPNSRTFIGKGKVEEVGLECEKEDIDLVIFDEALTPVQQKNLEEALGLPVIDRAQLILDIFAQRARSNEGKLQVELAQLKYLIPRLVGKGLAMSRLGGGIGTRGPGETQLEIDRRRAYQRMHKLERSLEAVKKRRRVQRAGRKSLQLPSVALVGYTNAGKSTLFNALTDADVPVEDKLFATLDTTIRKLPLPEGGAAAVSDTVGFIRKLPHELVAAFKATLEEVIEADIIVHVIDAANPLWEEQAAAVHDVLEELGALGKPTVEALNKIDLLDNDHTVRRMLFRFEKGIPISAKHGRGLNELLKAIQSRLGPLMRHVKCVVPYSRGDVINMIHERGKVIRQEYREEDILIEADIENRLVYMLEEYTVDEN